MPTQFQDYASVGRSACLEVREGSHVSQRLEKEVTGNRMSIDLVFSHLYESTINDK